MLKVYRNQKVLHYLSLIIIILCTIILQGCPIKLIADYDPIIDKSASDIQRKFELFIMDMAASAGTIKGTYEVNKKHYDEFTAELVVLRTRAESSPANENSVNAIKKLEENFNILRDIHKRQGEKGLNTAIVRNVRTIINTQFKAIITIEMTKKRGEDQKKNK